MPRPLTGGWRPVRATGAAPFRAPLPQGYAHDPNVAWPLASPDTTAPPEAGGDDLDTVRVLRADPEPHPETSPAASLPAEPGPSLPAEPGPSLPSEPDPSRPAEPAAPDGESVLSGRDPRRSAVADPPRGDPDRSGREQSPLRAAGHGSPPDRSGSSIVFDDFSTSDPPAAAEPVVAAGLDPAQRSRWAAQLASVRSHQYSAGTPRRSRRARAGSSRHHARRDGSRRRVQRYRLFGVSAVVVLAGAGAFGAFASRSSHHLQRPVTTVSPRSPDNGSVPTSAGSPTQSSGNAISSGDASSSGNAGSGAQPTGSTGQAQASAVELLSRSASGSVYQLAGASPITLSTSGRCWVEVRSGGATGPVIHEATLPAGSTEVLDGAVWLRLGNPSAVQITVGSTTLTPPLPAGGPYDVEFRSAS
jgi:hypothetical protein